MGEMIYKDLKIGDMFTVVREKHANTYIKQEFFVVDPTNHNKYRSYHGLTRVRKVENL